MANGVVAVTSQWTDGTRHVPVGVKPYRPASRLSKGKTDPAFHTKADLAWTLIEEARAAKISFRLVVADSVYGEHALLESRVFAAPIPYVMGLRPSHGTWQWVPDPKHPPACTPAQAAEPPAEAGRASPRASGQSRQRVGALHRGVGVGECLWANLLRSADCGDA